MSCVRVNAERNVEQSEQSWPLTQCSVAKLTEALTSCGWTQSLLKWVKEAKSTFDGGKERRRGEYYGLKLKCNEKGKFFWVWEGYLVEVKCYSDCGVIYRRMCSTRVNILSRFGNSKFQVSLKDKQKSNVQNQIIQFFKQWVIYKSVKHFPSVLRTRFFSFIIMCSK